MSAANAALIAILSGLLLTLLGAGTTAAVIAGAVFGLTFLAGSAYLGYRAYAAIWQRFTPLSPTPPGPTSPGGE